MKKGFTLIELLVVIAIISLLSALAMTGLRSARTQAENAQRLTDINAYITAFESIAAENGGVYPEPASNIYACLGDDYPSPNEYCWNTVNYQDDTEGGINDQLREYLPILPSGKYPSCGSFGYIYVNGNQPAFIVWSMEGINQNCGRGYNMNTILPCTWCKYDL